MRVVVLGSGTLVPDPDRGSPAHWVEAGEARLLLDCGSGAVRTMARLGLDWQALSHLFISHFHTDHVGDLAPLLFALKHAPRPPRSVPLTILGPRGLTAHMDALEQAHGAYVRDPGFPLRFRELEPGEVWTDPSVALRARTVATRHTDSSLGVRVEAGGVVLGYTGDTGPAPELAPFFRGSHVLVAECSHRDDGEPGNHLSVASLARLASEVSPELLVTVHSYPPLEPGQVPGLLASEGFGGRVLPGRDGLTLDLSPGRVEEGKSGTL